MHSCSFSNGRVIMEPVEPRHRRTGSKPDRASIEGITYTDGIENDSESQMPRAASFEDNSLRTQSQRPTPSAVSKPGPVTWMSLPRKDQLALLFICRFVDFLQVASLQAYVFYQLKHMDNSLSDSQISGQAGLLQGCFTGAQVCTAILWGKAADASWCGRKWVLVIGLAGTAISCLGYGLATTFFWAAFWRVFGGATNGLVGIM